MTLVFATHNLNKLDEVKALIPKSIKLLSLADIDCFDDIPETEPTIKGNAILKANFINTHYGYNCFADDTGLEVDALKGDPGVYSARYAGSQRNADANMDKLLQNLEASDKRNAQFKTVIALHINGKLHTFTGVCKGVITTQKQGDRGFGYDPIFQPEGYSKTFAQLSLEEKNTIGHRGKAMRALITFLNSI